MKKLILLFILTIILSCEKENKTEEKEECWTCTETSSSSPNPNMVVRTWEECDVLEAAHQDGRRWVTSVQVSTGVSKVTVHNIECVK